MPVRLVTHSSVVSRIWARSLFDSTAGGRHLPHPVMDAFAALVIARVRITGWPCSSFTGRGHATCCGLRDSDAEGIHRNVALRRALPPCARWSCAVRETQTNSEVNRMNRSVLFLSVGALLLASACAKQQ